jgi:hypothetical protein
MKEFRRCNERNVDLNRNCIVDWSVVKDRDPDLANYDTYRPFLSPSPDVIRPTKYYTTVGIWLSLIPQLYKHGFLKLKRSMVTGQYHHPEGIFYGGGGGDSSENGPYEYETSIQQLNHILFPNDSTHDATPSSLSSPSSTIISDSIDESPYITWIDVHTGLGPFGKDSLHYVHSTSVNDDGDDDDDNDKHATKISKLSSVEMKQKFFPTSYSVASSSSSSSTRNEAFHGYDLTMGMLTSYLATKFSAPEKRKSGIYTVQEFGTLPTILVGYSLIVDNMVYQYYHWMDKQQRQPEKQFEQVQVDDITTQYNIINDDTDRKEERFSYRSPWLKQAFYPQSTEWRASIIQRGVTLMLQSVELCKDEAQKRRP